MSASERLTASGTQASIHLFRIVFGHGPELLTLLDAGTWPFVPPVFESLSEGLQYERPPTRRGVTPPLLQLV